MLIIIGIAVVLIIPFWIRNVVLFKKSFSNIMDRTFNLNTINMCNTLYAIPGKPLFVVSNNFINYSCNLITKLLIFVSIVLIAHFTEFWLLTQVLVMFVIIDWKVFASRRSFYYTINYTSRAAYESLYKACICGPLYQTMLYILSSIVFVFEI